MKSHLPQEDRWHLSVAAGEDYFTQVPVLIWVGLPVWVGVAAKGEPLRESAPRAAVATITNFFMVMLLLVVR